MKYEKWTNEKIAKVAILCKTKQEMKMKFPKEYAAAKRMGILEHPMFSHMPKRFKSGILSKWSEKKNILAEALTYSNKKDFFEGSQSCYNAAKAKGWFEEACLHMSENLCIGNKPPNYKWTKEAVKKEALKFTNKKDFRKKSAGAWDAAIKNRWVDDVCPHMPVLSRRFTVQELIDIFKDCKNKKEAREKDRSAYNTVKNRRLQDRVFGHMPKRIKFVGKNSPFYKWTDEELISLALKYPTKLEFMKENPQAYQALYKRPIFLKACAHMKESVCVSMDEKVLMDAIRAIYPKTHRIRDMRVKIENKPHIHGFDIDIYVPEKRRGIEFDGKYHHSIEGLRRGRPNWPQEDLECYHELKDGWFASKGIQILHIKEEDWIKDKEKCIKHCFEFLEV